MRISLLLLALGLAVAAAVPRNPQRIVGGSVTTITQYPFGASLVFSWTGVNFRQACGGTIINNRSILTAAHCVVGDSASRWRIRVGSTYANSGGTVHNTNQIIVHSNYNPRTFDNDVAILRSASNIAIGSSTVRAASIAGSNYNLGDNQAVWAIGWGHTTFQGSSSEQLRHVQVWTVNQNTCRERYATRGNTITDNMLCSGWLDVGGRDQCQGDSGGPLIHNNVIVGVCSWGHQCALAFFPGVNARVSRYTSWIHCIARNPQRIVGGSVTTISQYPYGAALLFSWTGVSFRQACGGTIINNRSILTAAHCVVNDPVSRWRIRVGSTYANSGGTIHNTNQIIVHPNYNTRTLDNDVAILRAASNIAIGSSTVRAASIAGSNYNLADNQAVWAIGWGTTSFQGSSSEQLRHVQVWTVNQNICRQRYATRGDTITDNMLCSGWLDVGGRDQCQGDSGGPLIHNNVIVGVCSWGHQCAFAYFPGVNARVSRYTSWIQSNA